jgi:peptide/nickel transport system substrate-binding protein
MLATKVPTTDNGLISRDGLTYRFPLRAGVKFHDGSRMTAEDVRYSILRFMFLDRDGGPSSLLLEPILGITSTRKNGKLIPELYSRASKAVSIDGDTLVLHLNKPFSPLPAVLASFGSILSREWCVSHDQWDGKEETLVKFNNPHHDQVLPKNVMNGTGPFQLQRYDRNTKQIILERHENYWRKPAALKTIIFKIVEEFATRKLMLQAGDVDVIYAPQMFFPQLQNLPGIELIDGLHNLEIPGLLAFNFQINPTANNYIGSGKLDGQGIPSDFFSDLDIRKGFAFAIDYPSFMRDIYRGKAKQPAGIIPAGLLGWKDGPPYFIFDLDKARQHFKKAFAGKVWEKGFKVTFLLAGNSPPALALSQIMKKNIESLSPKFQITIRSIEWSTSLEQRSQHKIPFEFGAWQADYPDPNNIVYPLLHTGGYYSTSLLFSFPDIDRLIDEAARTLDLNKRTRLYKKIQDLSDENAIIIPITSGPRFRAQRSWVKGFVFRPMFPGMPYNSYYYDLRKGE